MRVGAIDLGTNSFLCLIADVENKKIKVIEDHCRVVRVGEGISKTKRFSSEALGRASKCLKEFRSHLDRLGVKKVLATATSAARDAENGQELLAIGNQFKIPISIISGSEEAFLSFEGAITGIEAKSFGNLLVVDVGGGSTELIVKEPQKPLIAKSFDVGCVRLTERFLIKDPIDDVELMNLLNHAKKTFAPFESVHPQAVIAVAGTPTTLAAIDQEIDFDDSMIDGYVLSYQKIEQLMKRLAKMSLVERKKVKGLDPMRADVIVAGAALLLAALEKFKMRELIVSSRGLRYGVALHHETFGSQI
jgi:exopolyphosphatase/guanosine-5'-triphosphate,3'-diphosphate pyrophosphatase